jgi:hypothetical protein
VATFELDEAVDVEALGAALQEFVRRHDTLRSRFTVDGDQIRHTVVPAADIALVPVEQGSFDSSATLRAHLKARFDASCDPWDWPAYLFTAVARPGSTTIMLAFDHLYVDGYAYALAVYEIQELYEAERTGRAAELLPPLSYLAHCRRERHEPADQAALDTAVGLWRDLGEATGNVLPRFPVDMGVAEGTAAPHVMEDLDLVDATTVAAFEEWCGRNGGTIFSGLLAVAAKAAYDIGGQRWYRTILSWQTRASEHGSAFGWYVNGLPFSLDAGETAELGVLVKTARENARIARQAAEVPMQRVAERLRSLDFDGGSWFSYLDFRRLPNSAAHDRSKAAILLNSTVGDDGDIWLNRTWTELYVHVRHPDNAVARANMRAFVESMRRSIVQAAAEPDPGP